MLEISLNVSKRTPTNKGAINQMRRDGIVPGIFYIKGEDPISFSVKEKELKSLVYTSETHVISLKVDDDEPKRAILKDVQFDPVTDRVIHIDIMGLTAGQSLTLQVPIVLEGSAIGVKSGGTVQHLLHKLDIECLPKDIPQQISIDISKLEIGDSIHVEDLNLENIKILTNEEVSIVAVVQPKIIAEETEEVEALGEEGEETAQPEVIKKGKSEEED